MENDEVKDLGCMNGWHGAPPEYTKCVASSHFVHRTKKRLGNCWYEFTCPICKIKWDVDSSD